MFNFGLKIKVYSLMTFLQTVLFPFSVLYASVTSLRNTLYDRGLKPSIGFEIPVIIVGNLTVGGTGKTPMIEYLVRLLKNDYTVATLSRGYGRSTKGFRMGTTADSAQTLGDEPYQFFRKFSPGVSVAVGEDRAFSIPNILQENEAVQVILLDDAFQHRRVRPSFNVLLSDYNRPFYEDYVLPSGRLRENRSGASRADVVIVTKCPAAISNERMESIAASIQKYTDKPIFFSTIAYALPIPFGNTKDTPSKRVIVVTGIAKSAPFIEYVSTQYDIVEHIQFPDHHAYTARDVARIKKSLAKFPDASVLTTEKDWVKWLSPEQKQSAEEIPFFYIPITLEFVKGGEKFDALIRQAVENSS
jgi:tetraacyldisaccharide 4'-kinase